MAIPYFPLFQGAGFPTRSPKWKTIVQEAVSGKDYALSFWSAPKYAYQVPLNLLRSAFGYAEWQQMMGLFNSCAGRGIPFHWTDPNDCQVAAQPLGIGDGATLVWLFVRTLGAYVEPVQDVVADSVALTVGGAPQAPGAYTLLTDPQWGLVYGVQFFAAPPAGAAVAWSGSYNWACRFDDDQTDFEQIMMGRWRDKTVKFTTVKVL